VRTKILFEKEPLLKFPLYQSLTSMCIYFLRIELTQIIHTCI